MMQKFVPQAPTLATTLAVGAIVGALVVGTVQAETEQPTIESVQALWSSQYKALDAHDADGVLATYADADDIMLMGTGPGEHWVGKEEVKDAYTHFMQQFDANTMQAECGEGANSSNGDVVWLTAVCHFNDQKGDQKRQFVANLSAVVVKQGDDWRFHSMHFSHLTGPDPAE